MYKNNHSILGLTKGRCKFTASDFSAKNPRTQNRTILILTVVINLKTHYENTHNYFNPYINLYI